MRPQLISVEELQALTTDCAAHVYIRKPSAKYAGTVSELLTGTALHESGGLRWNRQRRYKYTSKGGAWGLWQVERISIEESVRRLRTRPALASRCTEWLFQDVRGANCPEWFQTVPGGVDALCQMMALSPRLCCLFARLHYLWKPGRIPENVEAQAAYWKEHFNTVEGSGTVEEYLENQVYAPGSYVAKDFPDTY